VTLLPLQAGAVEDCELFDAHYEVVGYSPVHKQLAVRLHLTFTPCIFDAETKEFTFDFVDVYAEDGTLRRHFLWSGDRAALDGLKKLDPDVLPPPLRPFLKDEVLDRARIDAYLAEGKFEPVPSALKSPGGGCSLATKDTLESEPGDQPAARRYALSLKRAGKSQELQHELLTTSGKLKIDAFWYLAPYVLLRLNETEIFAPGMGNVASNERVRFVKLPAAAKDCWK
jgi:hypothetical protein